MYQMSMKFPAIFDQNPNYTFDKQITTKSRLNLDLEHKSQGLSRNQKTMTLGTINTIPKINLSRGSFSYWFVANPDSSKTKCQPHPYRGEGST